MRRNCNHIDFDKEITKNEWIDTIHQCLTYLIQNGQNVPPEFYLSERQRLPENFFDTPGSRFCYFFKGVFLPSANADGYVWKPSRGELVVRNILKKRYSYIKPLKAQRHVLWIEEDPSWCFLDYRCANKEKKIKLSNIVTPDGYDLLKFVKYVCQEPQSVLPPETFCLPELLIVPPPSIGYDTTENQVYPQLEDFNENLVGRSPSSGDEYLFTFFMEQDEDDLQALFPGSDQVLEETSFVEMEELRKKNLQSFDDNDIDAHQPKKQRTELSWNEGPSSCASWFYEKIFQSIPQSIIEYVASWMITQMVENRRFFKKQQIDTSAVMSSIKTKVVVLVDLNEFPGKLISSFFQTLYEKMTCARNAIKRLPVVHCIVCGGCNDYHDGAAHDWFFDNLDSEFVKKLKQSAWSFFDLIREVFVYLLAYPQRREPFKAFLQQNLHCPFCSCTGGQHDQAKHQEWQDLWNYYNQEERPQEPDSPETLTYTQSALQYLMKMPIPVPDKIYKFPSVNSFLECIIQVWKLIRLV